MSERFLKYETEVENGMVDERGVLKNEVSTSGSGYFLHLTEDDILEEASTSIQCNGDDMVKALEKGIPTWIVFPNKEVSLVLWWECNANPTNRYIMVICYMNGTLQPLYCHNITNVPNI